VADTPPSNIEAEQAVLGAMMESPEAIRIVVTEVRLTGADFHQPRHETIFAAITALDARGAATGLVAVLQYLTEAKDLARSGGGPYLHTLVAAAPVTMQVAHHATIVRDLAQRRRIATAGVSITQRANSGEGDLPGLRAWASETMMDATRSNGASDYQPIRDLMETTLDTVEAAGGGVVQGIQTGLNDLDDMLGGLRPQEMVVVAGRTSMGKSVFATDVLRSAAIHQGIPSALFSLEMSAVEVATRVLSAEARVPLQKLRNGGMSDEDWTRVARVMGTIQAAPLFIDASPNLTMADIRAKSVELKQRHGLGLVAVDYLQLMSSGQRVESRQLEVSGLSRDCKLLAKVLDVPVVALSQLNRGPEQRASRRPLLSDLRESGSIENDANTVILLHRDDKDNPDSARPGEADIIVAKNRNGPTGDVVAAFQGHYSRFVDMAKG
jgi:replicative DNA helicase